MKKILIALAVLASVQTVSAQIKSVEAAKAAISTAEAAAANPKKSVKAATWTALGKTYVAAYNAPTGDIWVGASKQDLSLVLKQKPVSSEEVVLNGQSYVKEVYADKNLYFDATGKVAVIEVTNPADPDCLGKAIEAYKKAYSMDPAKTTKEVSEAIKTIAEAQVNEAYNKYTMGDFAASSVLFAKAAESSATAPYSKVDTNSVYNAGFTALLASDKGRAKEYFVKALELGYEGEDGDVYAKLAAVDPENAKGYLESGFQKFPQSQGILIGLINFYLESNESTDRLFELLDMAKANEPGNASLYYVEGNIRKQLNQIDEAVAAYDKCAQIDPSYAFGYIGQGILFYDQALSFQEKAQNELDDNKYMALAAEFEKNLKACIAPFEKAFALSSDENVKVSIAEYLKNAYYRFSTTDEESAAAYKKYADIVANAR